MTRKIETIVSSCNDCRYMQEFKRNTNSKLEFVAICEYIDNDTHEIISFKALTLSDSRVQSSILKIPNDCPLEDYKSK